MKTGLLLILALAVAPASAAETKSEWRSFFQTLVKSLDRASSLKLRKQNVRITAVAAVRGAGQVSEDPLKPYWKGGWSSKAAEEYKQQADEFRSAAQLLLDGKVDDGIAELKGFKKKHAKSVLLTDVDEALKQAESAKTETPPAPAQDKKDSPADAKKSDE